VYLMPDEVCCEAQMGEKGMGCAAWLLRYSKMIASTSESCCIKIEMVTKSLCCHALKFPGVTERV